MHTNTLPLLGMRFAACAAVAASALLLAPVSADAASTTIGLTTSGTLTVDHTGSLSADLGEGAPSSGFFDVYAGTFSASVTDFPTLPVTQPYAFALFGSLSVGPDTFFFDGTSLPSVSAAKANALANDVVALTESPSGAFFPALFPAAFYQYDTLGDITVASQTNLADLVPDEGPFTALFHDGSYSNRCVAHAGRNADDRGAGAGVAGLDGWRSYWSWPYSPAK